SEKGWRHLAAAQRRMTVWQPRRAVVLGAGTVGIRAALVFRLRGLDVTVVDRREEPERRDLVTRTGAIYPPPRPTPLSEVAGDGGTTVARVHGIAHHAPCTARARSGDPRARFEADQAGRGGRRGVKKLFDVSLVLSPDMVTWPGEPGPRIDPLRRIAKGDSANV